MKHYRMYTLDDDNRICGAHDVQCADDLEARRMAEKLPGNEPIEIWQEARFVARVEVRSENRDGHARI